MEMSGRTCAKTQYLYCRMSITHVRRLALGLGLGLGSGLGEARHRLVCAAWDADTHRDDLSRRHQS